MSPTLAELAASSHAAGVLMMVLAALSSSACTPDAQDDPDTWQPEEMAADMAAADMAQDATQEADEAPDLIAPTLDMDDEVDAQEPDAEQDQGPALLTLPPRPWDVRELGPYNIGYMTDAMSYAVRPSGAPRALDVVFWYPTLETSGRRARYMRNIFAQTVAYRTPQVADAAEKFPLMIFSHGNGSIAEQSYFMTHHFASHGWVVVAPYHTENTIFDNPSAINLLSSVDRPQDITAVLDWITTLPKEHPLKDRIDMERIVMSGHSFGGFTTMASAGAEFAVDSIEAQCTAGTLSGSYCELFDVSRRELFRQGFFEPRIKAAIPHTPGIGPVFEEGVAQITTPMLMMTAARDRALPAHENGDYMWERMRGAQHARLDLVQGGHFTYSNMCVLFGTVEQAAQDGCNDTFVDVAIAFPIINHYALAFAEYHLLGETRHEALLKGVERPYATSIATYKVKTE